MYNVYILKSTKTGKYYIGSTWNIGNRLINHNLGLSEWTKNKGPFVLIYKEAYPTRTEAVKREKQIKSYKGGNAFKKLLSQGGGVVKRNGL